MPRPPDTAWEDDAGENDAGEDEMAGEEDEFDQDEWDDEDYDEYIAREFPSEAPQRRGLTLWQWTAVALLIVFLFYLFGGLLG